MSITSGEEHATEKEFINLLFEDILYTHREFLQRNYGNVAECFNNIRDKIIRRLKKWGLPEVPD